MKISFQKPDSNSDSDDYNESTVPKATIKSQSANNGKKVRKVVINTPLISDEFQFQPMDDNQYEPENTLASTTSNLKREIEKYKRITKEQQIAIITENTKTREMKLKLDETISKNKLLETELELLKVDSQKARNVPTDKKSANEENNENLAFSAYEQLLEKNLDQISGLSNVNKNLLNLCGKYQQCFDEADSYYQNSQNMLNDLHKSILDIIPPDLQKDLQKNQTTQNNKTNETQKTEENNSPQQKEVNQILNIVKTLIDDRCCYSTGSRYYSATNSNYGIELPNNDDQVLGHLENALHFIRTLKKDDYKENPIEDAELRELIDSQCKEIEEFLAKNDATKVASIFGESESIEEQLKTFYNMATKSGNPSSKHSGKPAKSANDKNSHSGNFEEDEEEISNEDEVMDLNALQPEVRKLFALFTAVVEVNKILFDRNRSLESEYKKYRKCMKEMKFQKSQMKNDLKSSKQEIFYAKDQFEKILGHEVESVEGGFGELCDMLSKTSDIIDLKDAENNKLKKSILKLKKSTNSLNAQSKSKDKQIASLIKKLNEEKFEKENAQKKLNETIEKVEKEKEKEKEQEKAVVQTRDVQPKNDSADDDDDDLGFGKRDEVRISLTQQLQDLQEENVQLKRQLDQITKEMDNYQASSDLNLSAASNNEAKVNALKTKMKQLKLKNAKLESQLQGDLDDVRRRNDDLDSSYRNQLASLTSELEVARAQLLDQRKVNEESRIKQEEAYKNRAKDRATQKKLEAKLIEAEQNLEFVKQQNELKMKALNMSYEKVVNDDRRRISEIAKKLKSAVNLDIVCENNEEEMSIDELAALVDVISERYDFTLLKDAALAKDKLKIGKRIPLSYAIDDIRYRNIELERKLKEKENERASLQKKFDKKLKEVGILTQTTVYKENSELKKWVEKLYLDLNDDKVCPLNFEETKEAVEKAIQLIRRPQTMDRKFDILRNEKKIFNNQITKPFLEMNTARIPVTSIKPLMLIVLFSNKIQSFAADTDSLSDSILFNDDDEDGYDE